MSGFRLDAKWTGRSWRCPAEEVLAAFVDQRIGDRERERVEGHLAACRSCRNQVGFLVRAEDEQAPQAVPAGWLVEAHELNKQSAQPWMPAWSWGMAAAAACLLLAGALWLRPQQEATSPASVAQPTPTPPVLAQAQPKPLSPAQPAPIVRNQVHTAAALQVTSPRPRAIVERDALEFRWKELKGALSYEVRLVNAEGDVLWEQRVPGRSAKLPPDVEVPAGETCFVWVGADLPDGRTVRSRAIPFTIADRK